MQIPVSSVLTCVLLFSWRTLLTQNVLYPRLKQFFATEAAFRAILLLFNLLVEFQRAAGLPGYQQPATLRAQVLTCGAILGRASRHIVLHLSKSWGGLARRIPLLDSILNWQIPISPKLESELIT